MSFYTEKFSLAGRRAVVTGASRGIGFEIARALGEAGAQVVLADVDTAALGEANATLSAQGLDVQNRHFDVTDSRRAEQLAAELEKVGGVDILVNNAGIAHLVPSLDETDDGFRAITDVNMNGVFWCSRAFGRAMVERRAGTILNVGSMSGLITNKGLDQTAYNASKAAVHSITRSLAAEWAPYRVRVNAIAPGYTLTEQSAKARANAELYATWMSMTPMGRACTPDEVASAALFLVSDAASYCTGTVLLVDGGYTSW